MQRYAITSATPREQLQAWAQGGVEWVQLREKHLSVSELQTLASSLAPLFANTATRFVINGLSASQSLAYGASGVHFVGGTSAETIRSARAAGALVSVSCHTLSEVETAHLAKADAILWSPVFGKTLEGKLVTPSNGLHSLHEACECAHPVAVFALGGVTAQNAPECIEVGATGVAGIRLFATDAWKNLKK